MSKGNVQSCFRGLVALALLLGAMLPARAQIGLGVLPPVGVTYYEKIRVFVSGGTAGCIANVNFLAMNGFGLQPPVTLSLAAGKTGFAELFGSYATTGRTEVLPEVIPNDPTGRAITCVSSVDVIDITTAPNQNVIQAHYNQGPAVNSSTPLLVFGGMTLHPGDLKHLRFNAAAPTVGNCVVLLSFVDQNETTITSKSLTVLGDTIGFLELLGLPLAPPDDFYRPVAKVTSGQCAFSVEYWDPTTGKTLASQDPILYGYPIP